MCSALQCCFTIFGYSNEDLDQQSLWLALEDLYFDWVAEFIFHFLNVHLRVENSIFQDILVFICAYFFQYCLCHTKYNSVLENILKYLPWFCFWQCWFLFCCCEYCAALIMAMIIKCVKFILVTHVQNSIDCILELHGWDVDVESAAGAVVTVCPASCWCAVSFAADGTVSNMWM